MLIDRLILGCARLNGGGRRAQSLATIRAALDGGIRAIDTAPTYGMGAADSLIGEAARGRHAIELTEKVGLRRPSYPELRGWLSRVRSITKASNGLAQSYTPWEAPTTNPQVELDPAALAQSLRKSITLLGRTPEVLLLHETYRDDLRPDTVAVVEKLAAAHGISGVGYAHGAVFDETLDARFPARWIAQVAPAPDWLIGNGRPPAGRMLRLHTLAKVGEYLRLTDDDYRWRSDAAAQSIADQAVDPVTARLSVVYALAAARLPAARLIFSSTRADRVSRFLAAARRWEALGEAGVLRFFGTRP